MMAMSGDDDDDDGMGDDDDDDDDKSKWMVKPIKALSNGSRRSRGPSAAIRQILCVSSSSPFKHLNIIRMMVMILSNLEI